jgi:hypothetical protein
VVAIGLQAANAEILRLRHRIRDDSAYNDKILTKFSKPTLSQASMARQECALQNRFLDGYWLIRVNPGLSAQIRGKVLPFPGDHHFNTAVPAEPIGNFPVVVHIKDRQIGVFTGFNRALVPL